MLRKMWIWMMLLMFFPLFPSSSVHASTKTYVSYTNEYNTNLEQPVNNLVLSIESEGYGVYQDNKLMRNFENLNAAIAEAEKLDFSHVVDTSTSLWVWDNLPNYDVLDAKGNKLVSKGFKYLPDAFHFTQSKVGAQLKNLKLSEILWNNASVSTNSNKATVNASVLSVRSGPSTDFPIIGSLTKGQTVTLLTSGGTWNYVTLPDHSNGYVFGSYISIGTVTPPVSANGKTVVLDAGHGGGDPGAIGIGGAQEKVITLAFTMAAKKELEAKGYTVVLTRTGDSACKVPATDTNAELSCRTKVTKNYANSIFISIHANWAYAESARGTETYYNANKNYDGYMNAYPAKSKLLSDTIHKYIQPAIGSLDRKSKDSSYYVLRFNSAPAILIELGFLSNSIDLDKMKNTSIQNSTAKAIATGVDEYFSK